jgi:hypothetical protein
MTDHPTHCLYTALLGNENEARHQPRMWCKAEFLLHITICQTGVALVIFER